MMCRLMLVDDDSAIRETLREFIDFCVDGFEVVAEAANGRDAVSTALEVRPDIILMDVRMPLCDGIQATRRIKRDLGLESVVITFTSYAWDEIREQAERAGASLHVQKPFDFGEVSDALMRAGRLAGVTSASLAAG